MDEKAKIRFCIPTVTIKNQYSRTLKANKKLRQMKRTAVRKLHQMAGIKGLSKTELYDKAELYGLDRMLYNNTVKDLDNLLDELRELKDISK